MTVRLWQRFTGLNKKLKRLIQGFLILLLLFALFGYLILPSIIRSQAEKILTQTLHRPVTIEKVSVSPFWLSVTLHHFKIAEPDSEQTFLSFDALRVRLSPQSIFRMTPVIGNITLRKPYVHLSRNSAGQLNIQDLLSAQPEKPSPKKTEEPASAPARHTIGSINIEDGNIVFEDTAKEKALRAAVEQFSLDIDTLQIDLKERKIAFDEIASSNALYHLTRLKAIKEFPPVRPHPKTAPAVHQAPQKPYVVQIENVDVQNWGVKFEDQRQAKSSETAISGISLNVQKITTELGKSNLLDVNARINDKGTLHVKGQFSISPLTTDLNFSIKDADIAGLRPFFADNVNLIFTSAHLSGQGTLKINNDAKAGITGSFKANAALDEVNGIDPVHQRPLLGWKSLAVKDIHAELMPLAVTIDSVSLDDYFANLAIDETGRFNLNDVIRKKANEAPPAEKTQAKNDAPSFKINKLSLTQGKIRFADDHIKPKYRGELSRLNVTVTGISSERKQKATLHLDGRLNRAPLTFKGTLHPFEDDLFLNLHAELRSLELQPLTPYSSQHAGYDIEEGTLSLQSQYDIAQRQLTASNRFTLLQPKISAQPTNPDAALPLPLALSLLRDVRGNVDINLPISGNLDDPDFSVGGLVVQALVNTIMKAVTSPFALLGSAFGDNADKLGWLAFTPGQSSLDEENQKKLGMLAEALLSRPALKLEITGMADPQIDDDGLRRETMQRKVRLQKMDKLGIDPASDAAKNMVITPDEYPVLLKAVYLDEIGLSFDRIMGKEENRTVEDMEKFVMAKVKLDKNVMPTLATQRADAAKQWLLTKGKVPADQLDMLPAKLITTANDPAKGRLVTSRVEFSIKR